MLQKNILVPVGTHDKDLGAVQHALSLAKRLPARVFILKFKRLDGKDDRGIAEEDILGDLVTSAWQAGLPVSYHTAQGPFEEEVIRFLQEETIHILVLGKEGTSLDRILLRNKATIQSQVILVRPKEGNVTHIGKDGKSSP